ncbi:hypothetical protein C8J56DRAFT_1171400 [Mycena floridula]|nr:hypothetical protein C8J56DRAFT_1171400 [Mycena floridula]
MLVLYGVTILQTYMYFLNYTHDHVMLKFLVFVVWGLATVHAIFVCIAVYHYDINAYTRPELILTGEWSVYAAITVGVCHQWDRGRPSAANTSPHFSAMIHCTKEGNSGAGYHDQYTCK